MAKKMNDVQARAYIQGEEPFDPAKYEREHIKRLVKSVERQIAIERMTEERKNNLARTVIRYIENHRDAKDVNELITLFDKVIFAETK